MSQARTWKDSSVSNKSFCRNRLLKMSEFRLKKKKKRSFSKILSWVLWIKKIGSLWYQTKLEFLSQEVYNSLKKDKVLTDRRLPKERHLIDGCKITLPYRHRKRCEERLLPGLNPWLHWANKLKEQIRIRIWAAMYAVPSIVLERNGA